VPAEDARLDNTILLKRFPGGSLSIVGANSARGFRRVSRKVVIFDETDGYPPSAGTEGDQIQLGIRRTEYYWDRKIILGSTPTDRRHQPDRAPLFSPATSGGTTCRARTAATMQVLGSKRFKWPKGQARARVYVCLECGREIEHRHKRDMVEAGEWRPGPHAQFPDVPAPRRSTATRAFISGRRTAFRRTRAGASSAPSSSSASARTGAPQDVRQHRPRRDVEGPRRGAGVATLVSRREPYAIGSCPAGVLFLTAGVDVQKDRLVYEVVGWGRDKRSWSIDAGVLPGDTSDSTRGPWSALEALLARTFPHAGGADLSIAMMAVDSGFNTQTVYGWARQHPMSRVIAVRGVDGARADRIAVAGRRRRVGPQAETRIQGVADRDEPREERAVWMAVDARADRRGARRRRSSSRPGSVTFPNTAKNFSSS
jgi:phage terminase large subunit GpA-like protein